MSFLSQIIAKPNLDPLKTMAKTAAPESTKNGEQPNSETRITQSPFKIDHEGEALAKLTERLRADAHELDVEVAASRLRRDHKKADAASDLARCLRTAADHIAAVEL